ncbi:hypothetical protein Salat_2630900 [Sesamum alatum]|uniref:Uncharacterized protein n=1 Tax=Sesamum alatum TaxID=300844 RepID=A0AAE2CAS1_9LAMI|nr:hypothetical protein Salat_2630900 [Sesamum alatum]
MFKAILCDRDQALLGRQSHTKVEEHFAHCMMKACAFGLNLSLKRSAFREDKMPWSRRILPSKPRLRPSKINCRRCGPRAMRRLQIWRLNSIGFDEGLVEGRAKYLVSDEHKTLLAGTRVEATHDFMKSSAFGIALEIKTARSTINAFELCLS